MTLFTDPGPDLGSYDWVLINSSGGKDSQVMLDEVYWQAIRAGVTIDRLVVVHADLGKTPEGNDIEWPGTAELAERQARHYGLRFIKIGRPQGDLLSHVQERGMWPSSTTRYCTSDHKRGQIRKVMTALVNEHPARRYRRVRILNCMGFRREESPARRKKQPFVENGPASNKTKRQVDEWLPVLEWTLGDVWRRIHDTGVPHHPVYDTGMPRLSCSLCVLASKPALVKAVQLRPELADEYHRTEQAIGHRFTDAHSMADLIVEADAAETPVTIPDWNA